MPLVSSSSSSLNKSSIPGTSLDNSMRFNGADTSSADAMIAQECASYIELIEQKYDEMQTYASKECVLVELTTQRLQEFFKQFSTNKIIFSHSENSYNLLELIEKYYDMLDSSTISFDNRIASVSRLAELIRYQEGSSIHAKHFFSYLDAEIKSEMSEQPASSALTLEQDNNSAARLAPIQDAAKEGLSDIVEGMLKTGKVDPQSQEAAIALRLAAEFGRLNVLKVMINCAVPYIKEAANLLRLAVSNGQTEVVKFLLTNKDKSVVNQLYENQQTLLMLACAQPNVEMTKLLVEKKAGLYYQDSHGETALTKAITTGQTIQVDYLLQQQSTLRLLFRSRLVDLKDYEGRTALMHVALSGRKESIQKVIAEKADPKAIDNRGKSVIMYLAEQGDMESVKQLAPSVDIKKQKPDQDKNSLLHYAVTGGNVDLVRYLIKEQKLSIDVVNDQEITPFMLAASQGKEEVMTVLKEAGADINRKNKQGNTPLLSAIMADDAAAIEKLAKLGVDLQITDRQKRSPLDVAQIAGKPNAHQAIVKALQAKTASDMNRPPAVRLSPVSAGRTEGIDQGKADPAAGQDNSQMMQLVAQGNMEAVKQLAPTVDIDMQDSKGNTLLHYAVNSGSREMINYLVYEKKLKINLVNDQRITPFMLAARQGKVDSMRALKEAGADMNRKDKAGNTALLTAVEGNNLEVIRELGNLGAYMNTPNQNNESPFYVAMVKYKNNDAWKPLVSTLVQAGANINLPAKSGYPILHLQNDPSVIESLIETGADPKALSSLDTTVLWKVVKPELLSMYVKTKGVDINAINKAKRTCLMQYIIETKDSPSDADLKMIESMLDLGANVTLVDQQNKSVFDYTSNPKILELLNKKRPTGDI